MKKKPKGPELTQGHLLVGRNALREVLLHAPGRILKVYVAGRAGDSAGGDRRKQELVELARSLGHEPEVVDPAWLESAFGTDSHQSFGALLSEKSGRTFKDFLEEAGSIERGLVLVLDDINDPHNLGAVLRAAECFGVDAVMYSRNRGAGLSPAAVKSSAGGSELVETFVVSNLVESVKKLKSAGFWIVAAEAREGAASLDTFDFPEKSVLILGSEGHGIHRLLAEQADYRVKIPLCGRLDSLNVSQAAAVLLYAWRLS